MSALGRSHGVSCTPDCSLLLTTACYSTLQLVTLLFSFMAAAGVSPMSRAYKIGKMLDEGRDGEHLHAAYPADRPPTPPPDVAQTAVPRWHWDPISKQQWVEVVKGHAFYGYQLFYDHWRNQPDFPTPDSFPHELHLGSDERGQPFLPFHTGTTTSDLILVTKSYSDLSDRILMGHVRGPGGIVITGQPGIGMSMS